MISLYLIICIVCALLLFVMMIFSDFGGDVDVGMDLDIDVDVDMDIDADMGYGDFHGPGISPLSPPILLVFGTVFGGSGYIFEVIGLGVFLTPILAVVCGLVVTGGTFVLLLKVFVKTQATTQVKMKGLVGKHAETTMPINPGSPGQIMVITEERGRTLYHATADEKIPTNAMVKIIGVEGNGVKVKKKGGK